MKLGHAKGTGDHTKEEGQNGKHLRKRGKILNGCAFNIFGEKGLFGNYYGKGYVRLKGKGFGIALVLVNI